MANLLRACKFVFALAVASNLAVFTASGADRFNVDFTKKSTGHARGLKYEYTFKVTTKNGEPVPDAEFTVVGDMLAMRGHHPTQVAESEPGAVAGAYKATLHFFMPGEWELKLEFKKPQQDKLLVLDMVEVRKQAD